jgi:putative flippase GtrA
MIKQYKTRIVELTQQSKKIRFLIAGVINTAVGLSVFPSLYLILEPMGLGYIGVLVISQLICITFSFISNKYFVFKTNGNLQAEYTKFFIFHVFYFILNLISLPALVEVFKMNPIFAQTSFSVFIIITSYFWHNFVTFKSIHKTSK